MSVLEHVLPFWNNYTEYLLDNLKESTIIDLKYNCIKITM